MKRNKYPPDTSPLTSIIILTRNGLAFTKECISSIFRHTKENFELILVDNGSTDGTVEFLKTLPNSKVIANKKNKGFSGGCNQGITIARGENIVLLNNDTVVTNEWLCRLLCQLNKNPSIGIVGPRSNNIVSHQAIIPAPYKTMDQMQKFASEWTQMHDQQGYEVDYLSGLCMIFKRSLIDMIGGLDERFSPGYFEDADFSIRAQISNRELWVANDVFIHHYGSSSFRLNRALQNKIILDSQKKFLLKWKMSDLKEIKETVEREKPFNREHHYIPV
ncbi:glycosyltransferase family 2 protein [Peribacillus simplex]|uniref:Glycosyl transferase family 2 n=2 Tax=Peribacillus simplex TaxID=1478 RepID=A0A223ENH5_9BACI|nr:glycosyltransferase family 2 protein [Peribacillus simplex]ASS96797.1 glycosyl transferase family 2 [Peribacillus simplex NBRC 15720 = DSM 1321]MEC1395785.1 glycosyltransferase family 2 protein [Peribacillus simplex]TVX84034.1 glycosyltransferase family 2 protein [Peribacillus simplex]